MNLTETLLYDGLTFYFIGLNEIGSRVYESRDEIAHYRIVTAPAAHDGVLTALVDPHFAYNDEDDLFRCFDAASGYVLSDE